MAICQSMIRDFMYGWENDHYGKFDLEVAIHYAEDLRQQGYRREPFHHYNLLRFIIWAEKKIKSLTPPPRGLK